MFRTLVHKILIATTIQKRLITRKIPSKMFFIRNEREKKLVEITVRYPLSPTSEREFNLNRNTEEPIGKTFEKLSSNLLKHLSNKQKKKNKKLKTDGQSEATFEIEDELNVTVVLYDEKNEPISNDTLNEHAWKEGYKVKINENFFPVVVDLPSVKKLALPKQLIANMPVVVITDKEDKFIDKCKFKWFISSNKFDTTDWELMDEGVNNRMIFLTENCEHKFVKIVCTPNDGTRDGLSIEVISNKAVQKLFNVNELPMTDRHKLTSEKMSGNGLRVATYNILAKCYADTATAKNTFYPYCALEHLDHLYRRPLLIHEIKNYNPDILFLQECDEDFFDGDLGVCLNQNYTGSIKVKGDSREGEATFIRKDRFKFVRSYDIRITDEITTNHLYKDLWDNISKSDAEMTELIVNRNTILQCNLVESIENPGNYLLLANTHLFFYPTADFIRLIQAVVCVKHIETIAHNLISNEKLNVSILFGGDFNSDQASFAVQYMFTQQLPINCLNETHRKLIDSMSNLLVHSLNLSTYADFKYTNYMGSFNCVLDYIFYDQNQFNLKRVIDMPTHEQVIENVALPSSKIPSDHIAVIFELEWKTQKN